MKDNYNNPPMFVTENGYCDSSGKLDDVERVDFYRVGISSQVRRSRDDRFSSLIRMNIL